MTSLRLMLRMLARDWRAGELTVLGIALVLAVAALTSVGFLADRVERALKVEAHQLLGADLLLTADHPWDETMRAQIRGRGLRLAETAVFPSMVFTERGAQLATIKAVSPDYPLRGKLRVAPGLNQPDQVVPGGPPPGEVWPDERLATLLELKPGGATSVGRLQPRVGPVLTAEPERGMNVTMLAPRLMMNLADLPATDLVQPGSRITYRLLVAGEAESVAEFALWAKDKLGRGEQMEDLENARPEVRNVIERAQRFLRLAALLAVVMAAVAVALAAERYMRRHLDGCAVMRCLGASEAQLLLIHGGEFLCFGLAATLAGCLLGYAVQLVLLSMLAGLLFQELPAASLLPWLHGLSVGLVLLAGFALPPLLRLKQVPTIRVLRREFSTSAGEGGFARYAAGMLALGGLMLWIAGELQLGFIVMGGFAAALLLYGLAAWGLVRLLAQWRPAGAGYGWRHGIANLVRYRRATMVQVVALGLGLTAILLLTLARGDLVDAWRKKAPPDAPNRFVINIQPEQVTAITEFFRVEGLSPPMLQPMVRGRLTQINGTAVTSGAYVDDRAKRLVEREFNLSWDSELPGGNVVTSGTWHGAGGAGPEFSVEQGLAESLQLKLGDHLEYTIGGQQVSGIVTSLRKLDWDSMRVNFFVIAPPGVLENYSVSYISSFHVPAASEPSMVRLVQRFPNLTAIDVGSFIKQLQQTLDQVATAVQVVFGFAVAAGLAVLLAALQSSGDERRHEVAVLRALGARRPQLQRAMAAEFMVLGGLAGLLGGTGAAAIGWALAKFAFKLDYWPALGLLAEGVLAGWLLVGIAGAFATAPILRQPPLKTLREAM